MSTKPTGQDLLKEFRTNPSVGTNFECRLHDMAVEGVDAQVVFPNIGLVCSLGTEASDYYHAWSRAYNHYVWDSFKDRLQRFKPPALLAVDDVDQTLAAAKRCIKHGFCTPFLAAKVPWQPYGMDVYEPLWSLAEEAGVVLNFHVFTGVDCLVWGNDYPHDEGPFPNSRRAIDHIRASLSPADAQAVLCGNSARLFGFDLDYLSDHREEVTSHLPKRTV
jgi:hypothetical protein